MDDARNVGAGIPDQLGDFRLLERLGAGGMGVVFRARDEVLSREVALKLILPENLYFEEARQRFHREVEAAAKLHHPGIVPVFSVGEEQGLPFFAMELVQGASLAAVLEHLQGRDPSELDGADLRAAVNACTRRFDEHDSSTEDSAVFSGTWVQACCRIAMQVADALHHAHERGVLHRDVKPSNILVTPSGRAMLVDFGLASTEQASRITRTGSQAGSMPYLPPERIRGGLSDADRRGDVYALGVSLYELLTLSLPFDGKTPHELFAAISSGTCAPLRTLNTAVPWDASVVCATAMERDPARRYATADALARDLRNLLELRPISARPPRATLRFKRWTQRNPTLTVAASLGFLLLVVAPSIAWWRIRAERDRALRDLRAKEGMLDFMRGILLGADSTESNPGERTVYDVVDAGVVRMRDSFSDFPEVRAGLLNDLAVLQGELGRPREAVALARESIELGTATWGDQSAGVVSAKRALATQLLALGEVDEAQRIFAEVRATLQRAPGTAGLTAMDVGLDFAAALLAQGRGDEAEKLLLELRADPVWKDSRAPYHVSWLTIMAQLARSRGRPDEASDFYAQALSLARATFGEVHDDTARAIQNVAVNATEQGRFEQALELLTEARDIRQKLGSGASMEDARLEFNLANACTKLGRLDQAAPHQLRALEISRKLAGDSAQTAQTAVGVGMLYVKLGRFDEAEPILRQALELRARFLPPKGLASMSASLWLARCLAGLGRHAEAVELFRDALDAGSGDPMLRPEVEAHVERDYADALDAVGRGADASQHRARADELFAGAAASSQ